MKTPPFLEAFNSRNDLRQFGSDALLLYALEMHFGLEDILGVATTSLTEGKNDKKADLIYIDSESGYVVIAQSYYAIKLTDKEGKLKKEAPSNKASDLNTAVSWLIANDINKIPATIKPQTIELREALSSKQIKKIYIWYVHNLPESENVKRELIAVTKTTKSLLETNFQGSQNIEIQAIEVGLSTLGRWYKSLSTPILVTSNFDIPIMGSFETKGPDGKAFVTLIPAKWLYTQYHKYKGDLFSADGRCTKSPFEG